MSLLALGLAAVTLRQRHDADLQRDRAVSRQVAIESGKLRGKDPALAGQTALAAYRVARTPESRAGLLESYAGPAVTRVAGS